MIERLILVGYRASGKTTVAQVVAQALAWDWVDADLYLEQQQGRSIADIFANEGEPYFRDLEHRTLAELCRCERCIIATGGGCVLRSDNRALFQSSGSLVVYLNASAACLAARLQLNSGGRPSLTGVAVADEVAAVLSQRHPLYQMVAATELNAEQSVAELATALVAIVEKASKASG